MPGGLLSAIHLVADPSIAIDTGARSFGQMRAERIETDHQLKLAIARAGQPLRSALRPRLQA
jgi:hypothetical protein